jgi:D-glycerate 3-kinase
VDTISQFTKEQSLNDEFKAIASSYFIPLAELIKAKQFNSKVPLFVGVNGCQGSGKSTFAAFIAKYLSESYQLKVVVLSLDDFYLDQLSRSKISKSVHPLLKTRGVPGTHDVVLLAKVLADLKRNCGATNLPRFSKVIDNPVNTEQVNLPVDIVLMEGWCWGVDSQNSQELSVDANTLEKAADSNKTWREYVNRQLKQNYQPLYDMMNFWIFLQAPSFDCVFQWRLEQENKLLKANKGITNNEMFCAEQVKSFIQLFQRLTEHALQTMAKKSDVVLLLDLQRNIVQVTPALNSL